jgi:hypothetical protein
MSGSVLWAETPDEDGGDDATPDCEAHGDVDDSFAARRLRRWLKGMFGGDPAGKPTAEPDGPGREPTN